MCSSIIFSPINEKTDFDQLSSDWLKFKENASVYENKPLAFRKYTVPMDEKWTADCVNCRSSFEKVNVFSKIPANLFFTRTYDDKYSVYVMMEENGSLYFDEYIKNVPILMNFRVPITDDAPQEKSASQEYHF